MCVIVTGIFYFREAVLDVLVDVPVAFRQLGSSLGSGCRFPLGVCLLVEFLEEEEEHDSVHADPPDKGTWVVAVDEEQLEGMDHDRYELRLEENTN